MGDTDRERREPILNRDVDQARRASNAAFGGNPCIDVPAYSDIPGSAPDVWGTTADDAVSATSCSMYCDRQRLIVDMTVETFSLHCSVLDL